LTPKIVSNHTIRDLIDSEGDKILIYECKRMLMRIINEMKEGMHKYHNEIKEYTNKQLNELKEVINC
jgi:hypothetical protein